MKALSLTQPWATLVAIGAKHYETRSWATSYRGPLVLTAENACLPQAEALAKELHLGSVIAVAELTDILHTTGRPGTISREGLVSGVPPREQAFGDFSPGRYAWKLENVQVLSEPIPARGALGLWEWEQP